MVAKQTTVAAATRLVEDYQAVLAKTLEQSSEDLGLARREIALCH